jgi:hypothetical protein
MADILSAESALADEYRRHAPAVRVAVERAR